MHVQANFMQLQVHLARLHAYTLVACEGRLVHERSQANTNGYPLTLDIHYSDLFNLHVGVVTAQVADRVLRARLEL